MQDRGKMNDEINLEALDEYLMSDDSPEGSMMLSDLDGFLHGIACSPVLIPAEEWMSKALGAHPATLPNWVNETVAHLYMTIGEGLMASPAEVEPIFWQANEGHVIAMDWCEGFMDAVALRPKHWLRLTESGVEGRLMAPIMAHMLDDEGNSMLGIPQDKLDIALAEAADAIPHAVSGIFRFWKE
jgi:uncharacterized protein